MCSKPQTSSSKVMPGPTLFDLSEEEGPKDYKPTVDEPIYTNQPGAYKKVREAGTDVSKRDHKFYPTRFRSLFEWGAKNITESPYFELAFALAGELFSSFFKWFPIIMVMGFIRSDSGVVAKYGELMPLFITVFVSSTISFYSCRRLSADANPSISFFRWFLPDITQYPVRYSGVKYDGAKDFPGEWFINGAILTAVKLATQFAAALLIVSVAHVCEPKGNLGFPNGALIYDAQGFPYMMPSASGGYSRAGTLLFISAFMDGLLYLSAALEFVKIRGHGISALYVGLGTTLAYMISYYATSTPLNIWLPLAAMAFHRDSTTQPLTAIFLPVVIGYGLATFVWYWVFRVTSQSALRLDKLKKQS